MMTSRERVRRAIHFQGPDRMPHYLPDGEPNDIVWLWLPRPATGLAREWREYEGGRWRSTDEWGSLWERFGPSGNGEVIQPALSDWDKLAGVLDLLATPPPLAPIEEARIQISRDDQLYYLAVLQFPSLYEVCHTLRGLTNFLADFYDYPDQVERLLDRLVESQILCINLLADAGVQGVMGYDDWGMQERLFISLSLWKRFFQPRYTRVWQHAHQRGLDVWLHSCGYILPLLPLMVKCGLNVIQMDQQENMGLENLGRAAGGRLAFWCPVDIQNTMVRGSPEDIEHYVREMIHHLGSYHGGLVSMAYSTPQDVHHTPEKIAAMCRAFRRWGIYQQEATGQ